MTTRRLAAILAADVVGFSSMMEKDEEGTLARVKALQREIIEPRVKERGGRVVKTTGDGFLCEFGSPVEAVRCAVEVQEATTANGTDLLLRMGINLGDIIIEPDGDIYGDGVNVAARLEQIAEPGGLAISGPVFDQVEGKVPVSFESRGAQQFKNIARPVRVYALSGNAPKVSEPKPLPLPDKPSIAVLPFTNMSGDPEQEYFADGVVEDIITALSRFKWLFVIARNSSFTYKGRAVDVKQVGRELGVRYVLEGSVRKAAARLRIAGQLIEASTGAHLWADRFEGDLEQVFELQDQVTSSVVGAIAPKLQQAEMERASRKPTESLDAYDTLLRGIAVAGEVTASEVTQAQYEEALRLFHRAIELDPSYATAFAWAAQCYAVRKGNGWMADPEREIAEAHRLARRAIDLGHDDAVALCLAGWTIGYVGRDLRAAATLTERALVLNPNLSIALFTSAWIKIWLGEHEQALKRLQQAQRLSPLDPTMFAMHGGIAHAHYHAGRLEDAAAAAERGLAERPNAPVLVRIAAAIYGMAGNQAEAKSALARLRTIYPDLRVSNLHELLGPYRAEYMARYEEGLRKAGLPE